MVERSSFGWQFRGWRQSTASGGDCARVPAEFGTSSGKPDWRCVTSQKNTVSLPVACERVGPVQAATKPLRQGDLNEHLWARLLLLPWQNPFHYGFAVLRSPDGLRPERRSGACNAASSREHARIERHR